MLFPRTVLEDVFSESSLTVTRLRAHGVTLVFTGASSVGGGDPCREQNVKMLKFSLNVTETR